MSIRSVVRNVRFQRIYQFKTKTQLGLELIKKALDTGLFPVGWVGFDAGFGSDSKFRDAVDSLQE